MADPGEKVVGESSTSQKTSKRRRHPVQKTQRLEAFFKECPFSDKDQRNRLAREVGLEPRQIKFWFQNKRTQRKTKNDISDNTNTIRKENERLRCEIMAMKEAMENNMRRDGPLIGEEERERKLEILKMKTQRLRDERTRLLNIISCFEGESSMTGSNLAPLKSTFGSAPNPLDESLLSKNLCVSPIGYHPPLHQENTHQEKGENLVISEIVVPAINEMLGLLNVDDPIWVKSPTDERWFIDRENYDRTFPNSNRPYKSSTARIESSKDCGVVSMTAIELIQNFIDPISWMNMFPTIVTNARIIDVLDSGNMGGSIQLMYEKMHILSPLVEARDFVFIRCCKQLNQTTWIMMDVSYDLFKESQTCITSYAWKFPSGCVIQDIGYDKSMVTWIEHVQVDEKYQVDRIFRDLLLDCQIYGAKRWIVTLQRMAERYNYARGSTCPTRHDLKRVINDIPEEMKNIWQLSQMMVKNFCQVLSMKDKLDFTTLPHLNSGDRAFIRKKEEITQSNGFIVTVSTSQWLPLPFETIFDFLKDDKTRCQWDVLTAENMMTEIERLLTEIFPKNSITIMQPHMQTENNMLVFQESSIDEMGAFLIYAPIDMPTITSIVKGGDAKKVFILPSGIIISPDGHLVSEKDNIENAKNGSILTVTFQKFICVDNNSISQQQHMEGVTYVHNLLSSTIFKIKEALGCSN